MHLCFQVLAACDGFDEAWTETLAGIQVPSPAANPNPNQTATLNSEKTLILTLTPT